MRSFSPLAPGRALRLASAHRARDAQGALPAVVAAVAGWSRSGAGVALGFRGREAGTAVRRGTWTGSLLGLIVGGLAVLGDPPPAGSTPERPFVSNVAASAP